MIKSIRLLKQIGQFDSAASTVDLRKLVLVYAENARGKTTLASILHSLSTGEPLPITARRRLGGTQLPEAIIDCTGAPTPARFHNGAWTRACPEVLVFDDFFVDHNVYSGMEVGTEHRQNLHDLILGATGVNLAKTVDDLATKIRACNATLRTKGAEIPSAELQGLSVDEFCALAARSDIDNAIKEAEQRLTALQKVAAVRSGAEFPAITLPVIEFAALSSLLGRTVADLDRGAAEAVRQHFRELGDGGEGWVGTGMRFGAQGSRLSSEGDCPFCDQPLSNSDLFAHYRAYFGEGYTQLQAELFAAQTRIESALKGDGLAGFERQVRSAETLRQFWSQFTAIPEITLDTTAIAHAWQQIRDSLLSALRAKRADPLTPIPIDPQMQANVDAFAAEGAKVKAASDALLEANTAIRRVKESVRGGNPSTAEAELKRLRATKARHTVKTSALCADYLAEKATKDALEREKTTAQEALETYRSTVFPNWQTAINTYLARLGANFTVVKIASQPSSGRPTCAYRLLINGHEVPVGASTTPGAQSFKTTLSAGDRNTLALAFFLSSLDQDAARSTRVVVLDDPMSSLDKHRKMATIQEIRTLLPTVAQVIVMSHDEYFLFDVYDRVAQQDLANTTALLVGRSGNGSVISQWDIESEKLGRHDKRHALLLLFAESGDGDPLKVAQSIRPHLEKFLRVSCPDKFKDGEMLREFRNRARAAKIAGSPLLSDSKFVELDQLVEYSNQFHHDTNAAADTAIINDTELRQYVTRCLAFVSP